MSPTKTPPIRARISMSYGSWSTALPGRLRTFLVLHQYIYYLYTFRPVLVVFAFGLVVFSRLIHILAR